MNCIGLEEVLGCNCLFESCHRIEDIRILTLDKKFNQIRVNRINKKAKDIAPDTTLKGQRGEPTKQTVKEQIVW